MDPLYLPGMPGPGLWNMPPVAYDLSDGLLAITAGPESDLFTNPSGGEPRANVPHLTFAADPVYTLAAHVSVPFASTFDAGVLLVWAGPEQWAKLCFEFSPQGEPMVVSVVNNGVSDDCNSLPLQRRDIFLRISRLNPAWAFHYSLDGTLWHLVRHFALPGAQAVRVGFQAQSPTGAGCTPRFAQWRYSATAVQEIRSGE